MVREAAVFERRMNNQAAPAAGRPIGSARKVALGRARVPGEEAHAPPSPRAAAPRTATISAGATRQAVLGAVVALRPRGTNVRVAAADATRINAIRAE